MHGMKVKISFKFALIPIFWIFIAACSNAASQSEINQLLSQGRGQDALKKAEYELDYNSNNTNKIDKLHTLLELCMVIDDRECFIKYWDRDWRLIYDDIKNLPKSNEVEKKLWSAAVDRANAKSTYRNSISPNDIHIKEQLKFVADGVIGNVFYEFSSLKTVLESRVAAYVGDRELSRKLLRRARALVLSRNLNYIIDQYTLALCLETSVYYLYDSQDAKRFLKSFAQAGIDEGKIIDAHVNPYALVRIYRALYESGVLNKKQKDNISNDLHILYKNLQLSNGSSIKAQKDSFYAYLALDTFWGDDKNLNFNPLDEFNKSTDSDNFDTIGIRAYLNSSSEIADPAITKKLNDAIKYIEKQNNSGQDSVVRSLRPTYFILQSLKFRYEKNKNEERINLEKWIDSQLDYFSSGGFTILDQPPAAHGLTSRIIRYVIIRLGELDNNSEYINRLAYFAITAFNASRDGDSSVAYSLLTHAKSDLQIRQIRDRIRLNAIYNNKLSDAYYRSGKHLVSTKDKGYDGGVSLLDMYSLLEKLNLSDKQLSSFAKIKNKSIIENYKKIAPKNEYTTIIMSAESEEYLIGLLVNQHSARTVIVPIAGNNRLQDSLKILKSDKLSEKTFQDIKASSLDLSHQIFGKEADLKKNIQIVSGPTFAGVPYTLLSNPKTKKWLIEDSIVESYISIDHRDISNKSKNNKRGIDYVAFANPQLRSKEEQLSLNNVASMIRGAKGGVEKLPELPETEAESINFSKLFPNDKKLFFGKNATFENLISLNYDDVKILSFATHGVLAGEIDGAKSSSIVLTPTKTQNGIVNTEKLFSINGAPRIVILSTCNSGKLAESLDSTEIISLSSAFLLKGSDAVISSYWEVNSFGTAELMGRFASEIHKTKNYSTAFINSLRSMIGDSKWSHPSIWAAFVTVGSYISDVQLNQNEKSSISNIELLDNVVLHWYKNDENIFLFGISEDISRKRVISEIKIPSDPKSIVSRNISKIKKLSLNDIAISKLKKSGTIAATQENNKWIFHEINPKGDFVKICAVDDIAGDWLIQDFFKTKNNIFSLFTRETDEGFEYGIVGLKINDCSPSIVGPIKVNGNFKGLNILRLFPLGESDDIVFALSLPLESGKEVFRGKPSELGVEPFCSYEIGNTFFTLSSNLKLKNQKNYRNLRIEDIYMADTDVGVIAILRDPCNRRTFPVFLPPTFFEKNNEPHKFDNGLKFAGLDLEAIVAENFEYISNIWWRPGGEYLFVNGQPIYTAAHGVLDIKENISINSFHEWLSGLSDIYAYNIREKFWTKIDSSEKCDLPQPLDFNRGSFFLCNDFVNSKNKRSVKLNFVN